MIIPRVSLLFTLGVIIFLETLYPALSAQERQYKRKSVTHIGTVVLSAESPDIKNLNTNLKRILTFPRFDNTEISDSIKNRLENKFRHFTSSEAALADSLVAIILPELSRNLRAVAEERALSNISEAALVGAAVQKMKGTGLTVEDLQVILNSAYLYLPVITNFKSGDSKNPGRKMRDLILTGYILWFKVDESAGKITLLNSDRSPLSVTYSEVFDEFVEKRISGSIDTYMNYLWAIKNAEAIYKHPDFQLFYVVQDVRGDQFYAAFGQKEGIKAGDVYAIYENIENETGAISGQRIGYARVDSVADNRLQRRSSRFTTYIGELSPGQVIKEQYSKPFGLTIRPIYGSMNFPASASLALLNQPLTAYCGVDLGIWYTIGEKFDIQQLYLAGDFGISYALNSIPEQNGGIYGVVISNYFGLIKKIWLDRFNFSLGLYGGFDGIGLITGEKVTYDSKPIKSINSISISGRMDIGVEYLFSPDFMMGLILQYRLGSNGFTNLTNGEDQTIDIRSDPRFDNIHFRGISSGVYISFPIFFQHKETRRQNFPTFSDINP